MKEVAVDEAKTRLSEPIVEVGQGGQIIIARRGAVSRRQQVAATIAALREQRRGVVLEGDVRDLISEGRD